MGIAENWDNPIDTSPYAIAVSQNPIGYIVWNFLNLETLEQWFILHFIVLSFSVVLVFLFFFAELNWNSAIVASALFCLSTVFAVLFSWVGSYDAWTFLGMVILLHAWRLGSTPLLFFSVTYLGFQHYLQALFLLVASVLAMKYFGRALSKIQIVSLVIGLHFGKMVNDFYVEVDEARFGLLENMQALEVWLTWKVQGFPYFVYSIFGPLILMFLYQNEWVRLKSKAGIKLVLISFFVALIPAVITNEPTRPFVYCMFLVLIWWITDFVESQDAQLPKLIREPFFWVILLLPPIVQFDGNNLGIGLRSFIQVVYQWKGITPPWPT
jgi:hypothetical protein